MPYTGHRITVGTTPTALNTVAGSAADGMTSVTLTVRNPTGSANPVYLGGANVTTGNGYELPAGDAYSDRIDESLNAAEGLYAVATANTVVHVLRRS